MTPPNAKLPAETVLTEMAWLRRLARTLVADVHAAEDVVQDTWMRALQKPPRHLEGGRLRAWLAAVARNVARRRFRDEANRQQLAQEQLAQQGAVEQSAQSSDEVERLRLQKLVASHVLALREPYRTTLLLRFQEGLSYERIAAREQIELGTARQRVSRGIALLRERFDREEGGRQAWCLALAPLARRSTSVPAGSAPAGSATAGSVPIGTTLTLGGITMGTKTAVAVAVVFLAAVGMFVWTQDGGQPSVPPPAQPAGEVAAAQVLAPETESEAPAPQERTAIAEPEAAPVEGALANVDPDRDLHGRVVDPEGEPVAGARIVVRRDDLREYSQLDVGRDKSGTTVAELESDALGEFAIPLEAGKPFFLFVEREGFARAARQDRYAGEFVEVQLDRAAVFAGRVVRASDGTGVQARIQGRKRKIGVYYLFDTLTNADGTFRFEDLEAGEITVELQPEGAAAPPWTQVRLVAGETVEHEFRCEEGFTVRGRVTDAVTGAPIAGAEISEGWTFDRYVATDARGEYSLENFQTSGVYDVAIRAAGYGRKERDLPEGIDGVVTIDFALQPGRRVVGSLVGPSGEPVGDAYVVAAASVFENREQRTDWRATRSGTDGGFAIDDLRPDLRHSLYVVCEGYATVTYDFPEDELHRTTIDLGTVALQEPYVLRGLVVGPDGEPLPDCAMELSGVNDDRGLFGGEPLDGVGNYCGERDGRTDHLGRFAFVDLAPAEYKLGVRPPDAMWHYETIRVGRSGRVQEVRIQAEAGVSISGKVLDPSGEGLAGVLIMVQPGEGTESSGGHGISNAQGEFRVAGLRQGLFRIQALPTNTANDEALLSTILEDVAPGPQLIEVHMRLATTITGQVLDAQGRAVMNATVRALEPNGDIATLSRTESDGTFTLSLEDGQDVDLIATPPPDDGPVYAYHNVDEALAARLPGVSAGSANLVLQLPER